MTDAIDTLLTRVRMTAGHLAPVLLTPTEASALVAEVERLRQTLDATEKERDQWHDAALDRRQALSDADSGRGYRADLSLDDIRCDVLDTGWPLGDDTDPERTPRRLVREVLAELAHVRDQRDNLQAACDRLRANADARERFLRRQGDLLRAAERDAENAEKGAAACDQIVALLDGFPVEDPCPEAARVATLLETVARLEREKARLVALLGVP